MGKNHRNKSRNDNPDKPAESSGKVINSTTESSRSIVKNRKVIIGIILALLGGIALKGKTPKNDDLRQDKIEPSDSTKTTCKYLQIRGRNNPEFQQKGWSLLQAIQPHLKNNRFLFDQQHVHALLQDLSRIEAFQKVYNSRPLSSQGTVEITPVSICEMLNPYISDIGENKMRYLIPWEENGSEVIYLVESEAFELYRVSFAPSPTTPTRTINTWIALTQWKPGMEFSGRVINGINALSITKKTEQEFTHGFSKYNHFNDWLRKNLGISLPAHNSQQEDIRSTITHEAIHEWLAQNYGWTESRGNTLYQANQINLNPPITVRANAPTIASINEGLAISITNGSSDFSDSKVISETLDMLTIHDQPSYNLWRSLFWNAAFSLGFTDEHIPRNIDEFLMKLGMIYKNHGANGVRRINQVIAQGLFETLPKTDPIQMHEFEQH